MNDVLGYIKYGFEILGILGVTVEVLPIKISPLKWIGNRLNKGLLERIEKMEKRQDTFEYENDMKDLRTIKSRIHSYGILIRKGEELPYETLKAALDDLDVYDCYKETYHFMEINGRKVKINGEVEADRKLIQDQMSKINDKTSTLE